MQNYKNVDEYLDKASGSNREELDRIRAIIRSTVPEAKESISYGMPAYKYMDKPLIYFGSFKNHYSIFPTSWPVTSLKEKLGDYELSKGTIKIKNSQQMPEQLLKDIVTARKDQIESAKR